MELSFTPEQIEEHNKRYDEGCRLVRGEFHLDDRPLSQPNWFARRRLKKAKALFLRAIEINPAGWNAMFFIGKIAQRFGDNKTALEWFLKAREFAPANTALAKEASLAASSLGDYEMAARIADEAIERKPEDPALHVNSGLAHILAGNCENALRRFQCAVDLEPSRAMNSQLVVYVFKVLSNELPKPTNEAEIVRNLK